MGDNLAKKKVARQKKMKHANLIEKVAIAASVLVIAILVVLALMWYTSPSGNPGASGNDNNATNQSSSGPVASVVITIAANEFSQTSVSLVAGGSVTWKNNDYRRHFIQVIGETSSPALVQGDSWMYQFSTPGTYEFRDSELPYMSGTITVS